MQPSITVVRSTNRRYSLSLAPAGWTLMPEKELWRGRRPVAATPTRGAQACGGGRAKPLICLARQSN